MKKFKFSSLFLVLSLACVGQQNFFGIETSFLIASKFHYQDYKPIKSSEVNFYYDINFLNDGTTKFSIESDYILKELKTIDGSFSIFYYLGVGKKKRKKYRPFYVKFKAGYGFCNLALEEPNASKYAGPGYEISVGTSGTNYTAHKLNFINPALDLGWNLLQKDNFLLSTSIGIEYRILLKEYSYSGRDYNVDEEQIQNIYQNLPLTFSYQIEGAYVFNQYKKKSVQKISCFLKVSYFNIKIQNQQYWDDKFRYIENGLLHIPDGVIVREENEPQFYLSAGLAFGFGKIK